VGRKLNLYGKNIFAVWLYQMNRHVFDADFDGNRFPYDFHILQTAIGKEENPLART
jgi:hypothetical protein